MAKKKRRHPRTFIGRSNYPAGMTPRGPDAYHESEMPLDEREHADVGLFPLTPGEVAPGSSPVLQVPTLMMRNMLERARETKLPRVVDPVVISRLRSDGIHFVSQARVVMERAPKQAGENKVYHWVRAHVRLALDDDSDGMRPWEAWLDFDQPFMEKLAEQIHAQGPGKPSELVPPGFRGMPNVMPTPKWVGSHSFEPVYERARELAQMEPIAPGQVEIDARTAMSIGEATLLADAHVLCVDPEQVEVLPQWEDPQEVFDYVAEMQLPFDPLYLDFSGASGLGALVGEFRGDQCRMVGALVWRQDQGEDTPVVISPYCWPINAEQRMKHVTPYDTNGWFTFGMPPTHQATGDIVAAGTMTLHVGNGLTADAATVWADGCVYGNDEEYKEVGFPGYAIMPFSMDAARTSARQDVRDGDEERVSEVVAETMQGWGELAWIGASRALAALSITEAVEVEIVDAPLETRVRKRAEKRRWPIAKQVIVRAKSRRYGTVNSTGMKANYSHRFWRRATVAHYPLGTMMADARPDLVTPCARPPGSNCGFCRKVKRPATIVGPDDKPLVLKTLVRHKP